MFLIQWVYFFLPLALGDMRRETQFIKAYPNDTMLTPLPCAAHLKVSQLISAGKNLNWSDLISSKKTQLLALTHKQDPVSCDSYRPEWTWERWQWRGTPHFPKLQNYWSLTIRLCSVLSRTYVGGVLPLCRDGVGVFYSPSQLGSISCSDYHYGIG